MGQYFNAVFLKRNHKLAKEPVIGAIRPSDFNNLAKLMEHSYIGNYFVNAFMQLINEIDGTYFACPCAWIGDSSEPINNKNYFHLSKKFCKATKYDNRDLLNSLENVYYKYVINFSKKEYIILPQLNRSELTINPLPMLLAYGIRTSSKNINFCYGISSKYIGRWAFNRIGCTNDEKYIQGLKELKLEIKKPY